MPDKYNWDAQKLIENINDDILNTSSNLNTKKLRDEVEKKIKSYKLKSPNFIDPDKLEKRVFSALIKEGPYYLEDGARMEEGQRISFLEYLLERARQEIDWMKKIYEPSYIPEGWICRTGWFS